MTYTVLPGLKVTTGARYEEANEDLLVSPLTAISVAGHRRFRVLPRVMP